MTASATSVQPGGTILFRISAWSTSAENGTIATTLTPGAKTPAFSQPVFTVDNCTSNPTKTSCDLPLPAKQPAASQIEAQVSVPKTAPAGETIKFAATVSVPNGSGSPLTATASAPTVTVAKATARRPVRAFQHEEVRGRGLLGQLDERSGSSATTPGVSGTSYSLGTSLPLGTDPARRCGVRHLDHDPGRQRVEPVPADQPVRGAQPGAGRAWPAPASRDPVADPSTIPLSLSSSEFGAQIVGLIILLLGVAIAVTRISLRKVRATGKTGS